MSTYKKISSKRVNQFVVCQLTSASQNKIIDIKKNVLKTNVCGQKIPPIALNMKKSTQISLKQKKFSNPVRRFLFFQRIKCKFRPNYENY